MISVEIAKKTNPLVFCAHADRVPLGIGYRRTESEIIMMGLPDGQVSFKIGLAV